VGKSLFSKQLQPLFAVPEWVFLSLFSNDAAKIAWLDYVAGLENVASRVV